MPTLTQKHCCQRRPDKSQTTQHLHSRRRNPSEGGERGGSKTQSLAHQRPAERIIKKKPSTSLISKHTHNKTRPPYTTCCARAGGLVVALRRGGASGLPGAATIPGRTSTTTTRDRLPTRRCRRFGFGACLPMQKPRRQWLRDGAGWCGVLGGGAGDGAVRVVRCAYNRCAFGVVRRVVVLPDDV